MTKKSILILRVGLGLMFVWISYFIWQEPLLWSAFLPSYVQGLLPIPAALFMQGIAVIDALLGLWLVSGWAVRVSSAIAVLHLIPLAFGLGFNDLAARDFGLLMAALALFLSTYETKTPHVGESVQSSSQKG